MRRHYFAFAWDFSRKNFNCALEIHLRSPIFQNKTDLHRTFEKLKKFLKLPLEKEIAIHILISRKNAQAFGETN